MLTSICLLRELHEIGESASTRHSTINSSTMGCSIGTLKLRNQDDFYGSKSVKTSLAEDEEQEGDSPFGRVVLQVQKSESDDVYLNWQDAPGARFSKEYVIESRDLMVQYSTFES